MMVNDSNKALFIKWISVIILLFQANHWHYMIDHPICKVSISFQKSFTIHVIARTKIISPIIYSNWEIANTWQIKTSKYSCDLNKTAHLVAISWTLADIHGQWVRRSFTHINSAHNTTPHPSLNNETKSVYKGLYPV